MAANRESLWEAGHDESVEVNQRALIDKVLARYSGEFTVFRELLQNSDDAASTAVEIHFETQAFLDKAKGEGQPADTHSSTPLPDLKSLPVNRWTFKNNGMIFRDEDWSRLKKIAEGNPDEEKIGAFGVGFYSLFSVTDEPFVTSGGQWMGFYWKDKKDQLFARRGNLPQPAENDSGGQWTAFEMVLREPAPIPTAFDFIRFLASSITFMNHLSSVTVFFDDLRLAHLTKDSGTARPLTIPKGLRTTSPSGTMTVTGINTMPLYIKTEILQLVFSAGTAKQSVVSQVAKALRPAVPQSGFFSSIFSSFAGASTPQQRPTTPAVALVNQPDENKRLLEVRESSVALAVYSADVQVKLDRKMTQELYRSTKKNPPSNCRLALIYTGKPEYDASKQEEAKHNQTLGSIFQGLRADLDGTGSARIFIGHATGQTTGIGGHIASRFIPTVERESIDLVDRNIAIWNRELLYVGGFLARSAYEIEVSSVRELWAAAVESTPPGADLDPQLREFLEGRCLHALQFFTFHPSTPSAAVSAIMESAFFACAVSHPFNIASTIGVKSASDVRVPDPKFTSFLKRLPVLPERVMDGAKLMITTLRSQGIIRDINFNDVLSELRSNPLNDTEFVAFLKWWTEVWREQNSVQSNMDVYRIRQQLIESTLLVTEVGKPAEKITPLSNIKSFINLRGSGAILPLDGPLPDHTLPVAVTKGVPANDLTTAFPWHELTVVEWLRNMVDPNVMTADAAHDITKSPVWAERVLGVLTRAWPALSKPQHAEVIALLKDKPFIPTRAGPKQPHEAYFHTANVFSDLPILEMASGAAVKGHLEQLLLALGVRKHVDLQLVFDRMIKTGDWTVADLVKYLVAVQDTLSPVEVEKLKNTTAFFKEEPQVDGGASAQQAARPRYKASELYEPTDKLRELGLPIIDWGTQVKWRSNSEEAKFLFRLGLRRHPPLDKLLQLAGGPEAALRTAALNYFTSNTNHYAEYDGPDRFASFAFVPAIAPDGKHITAAPTEVFLDANFRTLGFNVIDPAYQSVGSDKFKLRTYPSPDRIISTLEKSPPANYNLARLWFEVLSSRISDFAPQQLQRLGQQAIVPTEDPEQVDKKGNASPKMVAPKNCYFKREGDNNVHSKLFVFVDFGPKGNTFLSACGTKHEPSVEEIAQMVVADPKRFFHLSGGRENYLIELRNIAINRRQLSHGIRTQMKKSPLILASQRVRLKNSKEAAKNLVDIDEEEWDLQYDLKRPDQVIIADDPNAYQLFGDSILCAPQEDLLEEFCADLGCPRLSNLLREDYKTSAEVKDAALSREFRSLILERLPLFLHEHTYSRTRVQYSWLNNEKNFVVRTFAKLTVAKHLTHGTLRLSRSQDASAVARRQGYGAVELWLAGTSQVDMYEVATSLCRVLFESPKVNDSLLFMTILSTDLRSLRRRGYNVDRILKQQRAKREAEERARSAEIKEMEKLMSDQQPPLITTVSKPLPKPAVDQQPLALPTSSKEVNPTAKQPDPPIPALPDALDRRSQRPPSMIANGFANLRKKWAPRPDEKEVGSSSSTPLPSGLSTPPQGLPNGGASGGLTPRARTPQPGITPLSNIESNIEQAIAACRGESGNVLQNRQQMQMVKESMEDGYCDISGRVGDLRYIGSMADLRVYVSQEVPTDNNILTTKHDSIARFIYVIQAVREIYKLPAKSLHIFYDLQGDAIAFNRNSSIFLNLRFFEAWHDTEVRSGDFTRANVSWFFTLAHEIAHNLVQPHNAEHEFYFSSICEAHMTALAGILGNARSAPS